MQLNHSRLCLSHQIDHTSPKSRVSNRTPGCEENGLTTGSLLLNLNFFVPGIFLFLPQANKKKKKHPEISLAVL